MPIKAVHLSADAYLTCLYHALSTEKQEIMGLLLGIFYFLMYLFKNAIHFL